MNFNEEIFEELKTLGFAGRLVEISEEDKGTPQDYLALEKQLSLADLETTRMLRESSLNARLGMPCGQSVAKTVKKQPKPTNSYYGVEELQKLFLETSFVDNFTEDSINQCDTISNKIPQIKIKK